MDWRKITINALTGLAVAIVSGILVWALTKEPKYREGVFYEIENAGSFGSGEDKLSFYKISVKNNGEQKSRNLFFRLIPRNLSAIRQSEIKRSLSEPKISNKRSGTNGLNFNINELLPSEFINVYVVLSGAEKEPSIIIKTENSIVRRIENDDGEPSYSRYKLFIMLFFFGLSPLAMRFVLKTAYARGNFRFASKSKNNAGFLLFHSGLILLAEEILEAALKDGNCREHRPF